MVKQNDREEDPPLIEDDRVTYKGLQAKPFLEFGIQPRENELTLVLRGKGKVSHLLRFQHTLTEPSGQRNTAAVSISLEGEMSSGLTLEDDIPQLFVVEARLEIVWEQGWDHVIFRLCYGSFILVARPSCWEMRSWFDFDSLDAFDFSDVDHAD